MRLGGRNRGRRFCSSGSPDRSVLAVLALARVVERVRRSQREVAALVGHRGRHLDFGRFGGAGEGVELGGRRSKIHREKMTALAMPRVIVRKDK